MKLELNDPEKHLIKLLLQDIIDHQLLWDSTLVAVAKGLKEKMKGKTDAKN